MRHSPPVSARPPVGPINQIHLANHYFQGLDNAYYFPPHYNPRFQLTISALPHYRSLSLGAQCDGAWHQTLVLWFDLFHYSTAAQPLLLPMQPCVYEVKSLKVLQRLSLITFERLYPIVYTSLRIYRLTAVSAYTSSDQLSHILYM